MRPQSPGGVGGWGLGDRGRALLRRTAPIYIGSGVSATRVGQIVIEWSVLERELEELIQMLVNTDIGFSRIMTNRMSARNRADAA
jgi:hypothetical protein